MGMKSLLVRQIGPLGRYVKGSPRARGVVMAVLALSPGLNARFRRLYLGTQLGASPSAADFVLPAEEASDTGERCMTAARGGINAGQRTPLEAHFHSYVGHK